MKALGGVCNALIPLFIKNFVELLEAGQTENVMSQALWLFGLFILIVVIIGPLLEILSCYVEFYIMPVFMNMTRRQLSLYMHEHSYSFFQDDFAGRLASKVIETPNAMRSIVSVFMGPVIFMASTYVVSAFLFMSVHWAFGLVLVGYGVLYWMWFRYMLPEVMERSKISEDVQSYVRGRYVDTLTNMLQVKLFGRKDMRIDIFLKN